jgi:hypothetical protein
VSTTALNPCELNCSNAAIPPQPVATSPSSVSRPYCAAITSCPSAWNAGITLLKDEPSAQIPCGIGTGAQAGADSPHRDCNGKAYGEAGQAGDQLISCGDSTVKFAPKSFSCGPNAWNGASIGFGTGGIRRKL